MLRAVDRILSCELSMAGPCTGRPRIMNSKTSDGRRRRQKSDKPNPIDIHVGSRVRLRRTLLGLSQDKLGEAISLTFQQVQKDEPGGDRPGARRLSDPPALFE